MRQTTLQKAISTYNEKAYQISHQYDYVRFPKSVTLNEAKKLSKYHQNKLVEKLNRATNASKYSLDLIEKKAKSVQAGYWENNFSKRRDFVKDYQQNKNFISDLQKFTDDKIGDIYKRAQQQAQDRANERLKQSQPHQQPNQPNPNKKQINPNGSDFWNKFIVALVNGGDLLAIKSLVAGQKNINVLRDTLNRMIPDNEKEAYAEYGLDNLDQLVPNYFEYSSEQDDGSLLGYSVGVQEILENCQLLYNYFKQYLNYLNSKNN